MKKEGTESVCATCGGSYYVPPSRRANSKYCSMACFSKADKPWLRKDLADRFWEKVEKTATCWLWTGALLKKAGGYGSIRIDGKALRAHRVAYELVVGPIPDGMLLRHSCDTPRCVNPDHLIPGYSLENTKDALDRGRFVVGEGHKRAKLTNHASNTIRAALAAGVPGAYLARQFGVSPATISMIKTGKKWKYV